MSFLKGRTIVFTAILLAACVMAFAATSPKVKSLASQIKKDLRAVENMHDAPQAVAKLDEIRKKIDELKAEDSSYPEINSIESSYRRNRGLFEANKSREKTAPAVDDTAKKQALKDWQDMVNIYDDFRAKLDPIIPHGKYVIYEGAGVDAVMARVEALRAETPGIKRRIEEFTRKYGSDIDTIDRKLAELTPLNMKASRYSDENRRPDESAGLAVDRLTSRMADLEDAPAYMARQVLSNAIRTLSDIESFPDTTRDARYVEVEKEFSVAAKLDPKSAEVKAWHEKAKNMRAGSKANVEKELNAAKFPSDIKGFSGPGNPAELKKSVIAFYDSLYPKEKAVAVSIAGNWMSAKKNIFGETIQWGLPVNVAAYTKNNPDICRVFNLTVVTREALGVKKTPPWDAEWVGNSYRMRTKNVPK